MSYKQSQNKRVSRRESGKEREREECKKSESKYVNERETETAKQ